MWSGRPFRKLFWSYLRTQDLKKGSVLMWGGGRNVRDTFALDEVRVRLECQFSAIYYRETRLLLVEKLGGPAGPL